MDAYAAHAKLAHRAMDSALETTVGDVKQYLAWLARFHAQSARGYAVERWQHGECDDLIREAQSVLSRRH